MEKTGGQKACEIAPLSVITVIPRLIKNFQAGRTFFNSFTGPN